MDSTSTTQIKTIEPNEIENKHLSIVKKHYERKGYRVHSGLQFGCHLVLYADTPDAVHSDYCIHILPHDNSRLQWCTIQTLVRSMSDLHKRLIIVNVDNGDGDGDVVHEMMIGTEHAPMRQKKVCTAGSQLKKQKMNNIENGEDNN